MVKDGDLPWYKVKHHLKQIQRFFAPKIVSELAFQQKSIIRFSPFWFLLKLETKFPPQKQTSIKVVVQRSNKKCHRSFWVEKSCLLKSFILLCGHVYPSSPPMEPARRTPWMPHRKARTSRGSPWFSEAGFHGWRCPTIQTPKLTLEVAFPETNTSHLPGSRAPKGNDPRLPTIYFQVRKCYFQGG